jgi:hypothetical protein
MEEEKQSDNLIQQAQKAAERLEKANKEMAALLERQERNRAIDEISGKSLAKVPEKELTPEEIIKKQTQEFFKGSEIELALKKYG